MAFSACNDDTLTVGDVLTNEVDVLKVSSANYNVTTRTVTVDSVIARTNDCYFGRIKDPETGEYLTALQKYEMEHRADFLKYVGLFMTLTNGFKDFDSFTKGKVKKELKKGLRELEQTLSNSHRGPSGGLKMVTNAQNDPESYFGKGFKLDI
jgi:hypothetical protein